MVVFTTTESACKGNCPRAGLMRYSERTQYSENTFCGNFTPRESACKGNCPRENLFASLSLGFRAWGFGLGVKGQGLEIRG